MKNKLLFRQAENVLVGGVNSPVRSFSYVGGQPVLIKRGKGAKVYDYNGKGYIDYCLSFGAMILGHAYPAVVKAVRIALKDGFSFGATNLREIELASIIKKAVPFIDKIRFVNSGTEAVMGAVRLARGYTNRNKIVKARDSYHGHADYLLIDSGSGLSSLSIPFSKGVPLDFVRHTVVVNSNDKESIRDAFHKYGDDIAGVIVEPVGGNHGVGLPDGEYIKYIRGLTKKYGALLIFDEVITGFRFLFGSSVEIFEVEPDLVCLGKIIGGGLPIGAYGGRGSIMDKLAPIGDVYQASSFAGNPVVMASGTAALNALILLQKGYVGLIEKTAHLSEGIRDAAGYYKFDVCVSHYGTMFSLKFKDKSLFSVFYRALLEAGIYLAPSEYEANFLSFAHTDNDIDKTITAVKRIFRRIKR